MLKAEVKHHLMRLAIEEARKSVVEDGRVHPRVGAVLADADGIVLHSAHRGEGAPGQHAEFVLFQKAGVSGTDTTDKHLFVTLEPCTRRGEAKIPCAVRVMESRVRSVHIGTLDPNPHITGRGELYLSAHTEVERFPGSLTRELAELNRDFFDQHRHDHVPVISPYVGGSGTGERPRLSGQREALMQQSMDLITGSHGDVWSLGGGLSWLRELQIAVLIATLNKRQVRFVCNPREPDDLAFTSHRLAAQALGASVVVASKAFSLRGTLIGQGTEEFTAICIEKRPGLHGHLFRAPHDRGILDALGSSVETLWADGEKYPATEPIIEQLDLPWLKSALKSNVPAYRNAVIDLVDVPVGEMNFLPKALERFKLFRLSQLEALRVRHTLPSAFVVRGSPWPVIPPIVEEQLDGRFVVIDGAHRIYSAITRNQRAIEVLKIRGCDRPLPATPQASIDSLQVKFERLPRHLRYDNLMEDNFRPIRQAFEKALSQR